MMISGHAMQLVDENIVLQILSDYSVSIHVLEVIHFPCLENSIRNTCFNFLLHRCSNTMILCNIYTWLYDL